MKTNYSFDLDLLHSSIGYLKLETYEIEMGIRKIKGSKFKNMVSTDPTENSEFERHHPTKPQILPNSSKVS